MFMNEARANNPFLVKRKALNAQALGHGKTTVTDTYFDYELVDDLNRRVLDCLININ